MLIQRRDSLAGVRSFIHKYMRVYRVLGKSCGEIETFI